MKKIVYITVILLLNVMGTLSQDVHPWTSLNVNGINYTLTTKSTTGLGISPIFYNQHKNSVFKVFVHNDDQDIYLDQDFHVERVNAFINAQNKLKHEMLPLSFLQQDQIDPSAMMGFPKEVELDALGTSGLKTIYYPTFYISNPVTIQEWGDDHVWKPDLSHGLHRYSERVDVYKDIIYTMIIPEMGSQNPDDSEVFQMFEAKYDKIYGAIYDNSLAQCFTFLNDHPEIEFVEDATRIFLDYYINNLQVQIQNIMNSGTIPVSMIRHFSWAASLDDWLENAGMALGVVNIMSTAFESATKGLMVQAYSAGLAQERLGTLNYIISSGLYNTSLPGYDNAFIEALYTVNDEFGDYENQFWYETAGDIFTNQNFWIQTSTFTAVNVLSSTASIAAMKVLLPLKILYWSWETVANQDDCTQRMALATNIEKTFLQLVANTNISSHEQLLSQLYIREWLTYLSYYVYGNYGTRMYEQGWLTGFLNWINQKLSEEGTFEDFDAVRENIQSIERFRFGKYLEYHAPMFYLTPADQLGQTTWMFGLLDVPEQQNPQVGQIDLQAGYYCVNTYAPVELTATVRDASDNLIKNELISFSTNNDGYFTGEDNTSISDANGIATITYIPTEAGNHMITASAQSGANDNLPSPIFVGQGVGSNRILRYEYWIDDYASKKAISITPVQSLQMNQSIQVQGLTEGIHTFNIHFMDNTNNTRLWSQVISQIFYVEHSLDQNMIVSYTYWVDQDIDSTSTMYINESPELHLIRNFPVENLTRGLHTFHIRFNDKLGLSSPTNSVLFYYDPLQPQNNKITSYQYWIDDFSDRTSISISPTQEFIHVSSIPLENLSRGLHVFNIRYKDRKGKYSEVLKYYFYYTPSPPDGNTVTVYRYFFDDNFVGQKIIQFPTAATSQNLLTTIAPSGLPMGPHQVYFQVMDTLGQWSSIISSQISITSAPANRTVTNITVNPGQDQCYDATQTLTVGGDGTSFIVKSGGNVNLIAGQKINFLPGVAVQPDGYLHGYITSDGSYCSSLPPAFAPKVVEDESEILPITQQSSFKIYPNPTTGSFIMELKGEVPTNEVTVDVYGMWGELVLSKVLSGERKHEFSLSDRPVGIYFIRVISGDKAETVKIIKQ